MSKHPTYITAKKIQEQYDVSVSTPRNWENEGKIEARRTPGGKRLSTSQQTLPSSSVRRKIRLGKPKSAMQGSVATTKKKTSKGKSKTLGKRTRTTKSSQRLEVESTGIGRSLTPFWTERSRALSQRLLLPTETDCVDLDMSLLPKSSRNLVSNSWFKVKVKKVMKPTNSEMTCLQLSRSLWQKTMANAQQRIEEREREKKRKSPKRKKTPPKEEKKKAAAEKSIKIKLQPNKEEKEKLKSWLGVVRWTYNQCLASVNSGAPATKSPLRKLHTHKKVVADKPWVKAVLQDVRNEAVADLVKNFKSNNAKNLPFYEMKFKTKKDKQQSFVIHNKHWNACSFKPKLKKDGTPMIENALSFVKRIKATEPLPDQIKYDSRLVRDKLGIFYICFPAPLEVKGENQAPSFTVREQRIGAGVIALDPGVRTFQTTFSPSGLVTEWGNADMGRIQRLCYWYDDLQRRWSQKEVGAKKRYRMKKAGRRIHFRIRNLVDELHKKLVRWLCLHHTVVLLPKFDTQQMVRRGRRKLRSKTARMMMTWSHFRFRQRLLFKAKEYPWCKVMICREEYTSKTCGACGNIHRDLGGNKEFKCPECKVHMDRDYNGARNILLKFLTENSVSEN